MPTPTAVCTAVAFQINTNLVLNPYETSTHFVLRPNANNC